MNIFQKQISELRETDLSDSEIAELLSIEYGCATNQSTINRILNAKIIEPKWSLGNAINQLHKDRVDNKAA